MNAMRILMVATALVSAVAYGENPPPPPGPEGWAFRRELAEDPPPDYAAPTGKPWLENRISRCFFSPIKRPPFNRDELKDDIDYYPDNYLERLRREGVNGLWLSLALRDMDEASLAKLGRTVAKCAAHGIKVWAFCIEPRNRPHDDPFFLAHPDARGAKTWDGNYVNCPSSPAVLGEIEELVARIFRAVPGLAGMINIANGERATTCLSFAPARVDCPKIPCAKCAKREPWELYAEVANAMVRGMRKGNPEARLISWFYQPEPSPTRGSWVYECARHAPEGVEFQFNFESGAVREQVGKTRIGGDYWLSFPGPAAPFERVAEVSREVGKPLSAKIQTSCSHECATVPYVPVPGLLYRKFRGMRDAGVRDVMMCWYFGNAPGLMNRAAGLLAYEDFRDGEDAFLERLAKDEWGEDAAVMGGLWRRFSDAYSHYPLSNDIQYYGPFHAGFSWPLYPSVSMRSLQRTWKPLETPGGDLIGECLADFSLEDAFACADRMVRELDGVRPTLARLRTKYANDRSRRRDLGIMVTLMDLFESARDIFRFYIVRRDGVFASRADGDSARALACIGEMKDIIARERGRSEEMIPLCADDSRLGFHSEAQAHQFTSAYLRWRVGELAKADAELQTIERDLKAGRAWPESERERTAKVVRAEELADGSLVFEGECPELAEGLEMELRTYDLCGTAHARVHEVKPSKGRYRLVVSPSDWGNDPKQRPAWVVIRQGHDYNNGGTTWAFPDIPMFPEPRLHQDALTGDNFARIRPARGRGALVLTFDDPRYDDWIRQIPLFERYGAHATFFPCGHIGTNEVAKLKRLAAAGHSIGIHTEHHRDADRAFSEEGAHMFMRDEINPQLKACADAGLEIRYLAYPNNRHTPETDGYLAGAFRRFRAGVKGMTGYHTNGTSIVTLDRAFFPVADLPKHRVMEGTGVGAYYSTDIDDLCRGIRRAAERDEVLVLFSHDISENPGRVGMRTEWLEKLLATAKDCGVAVKGFDELGPVDPQMPQGPMRLYLTFDDGIKEHLFAADELEKRGWRGIFCIVTDWIGKEGKLTWDDVRELHRRGHVIANHTKTHRGLGNLWKQGLPDEVRKEILGGADAIERETGTRPKLLCLPGTSGHKEVTKTAAELGETTMLVPRHCFGDWPHTSGDVIDRLRANGQRQADFLVHGVSAAGGGWRPFATREDFIRYLDGIKAAEDAGKVNVSWDYAGGGIPLGQLRFSAGQTAPDLWPRTLAALDRHGGTFDEVWFSTGCTYPALAWHKAKAAEQAKAAIDLRARGIAPSLEVQVTLGHGFIPKNAAELAGKTWTGFTGVGGGECPAAACPRDPRFLDYISESTSYYAAYRPPWVWIDDDLRVLGHGPASPWEYSGDRRTFGCWCERCVGDFAKREGRAWTRETLAKAIGDGDAALGDRWETFAFESIAGVARRIAERFHALSPETCFGYQHAPHFTDRQRLVFKALHEATGGNPVGDRPGGGWYQDHDPYSPLLKAYRVARESADLGEMPEILVTTPEIETYPRVFTSRTANGILIESLASLTMGMNALSMFFMDSRTGETVDFYERRFLGPLAANMELFRAFRRHTEGTLPAGLRPEKEIPVFTHHGMCSGVPEALQLVTGVPIVYGKARALGTIDLDETNARALSSAKLLALYAEADARAGGRLPVVPTEPIQGWLMPRTTADGTLRSVTYLNTTLDESWPTRLRLRGVAKGTRTAKWWPLDGAVRTCEVTFDGGDAFVTLPPVAHWSGGWLQL